MGTLQNMLNAVLPETWMSAMETESRDWVMRCPCGAETSVWEMGGIRYLAAGNPRRFGRCGVCGRGFRGKVYRREQNRAEGAMNTRIANNNGSHSAAAIHAGAASIQRAGENPMLLWIDGVGCWRVEMKERITIGGPAPRRGRGAGADLALMADLSTQHAALTRSGEVYLFEANGPAMVNSTPYTGTTVIQDGQTMQLGESVRLRFHQPTSLSATARIEFLSGHRPARRIDGVVLLDQVCLLGPTADCHVVCADWPEKLVLFRRDGRLWVKAAPELFVNGCRKETDACLRDGTLVTTDDLRLRVEVERTAESA